MKTICSLFSLTAEDLMSRDVVRLPKEMPLRDAARLLIESHVGGAPVVDRRGKCIGVLSATDFLGLAGRRIDATNPAGPPLPITCSFQVKRRRAHGQEVIQCTLPGACPIQVKQVESDGEEWSQCSQPNCVLVDWQLVDVEKLPVDEVQRFMTVDPVTVRPEACIRTLCRMMIEAHIHRIIVVDDEQMPIGIVSSTDLLAALAYAEDEE
jgi:CBS-domain-containing membrane protein